MATRQQGNKATRQQGNKATRQQGIDYHPGLSQLPLPITCHHSQKSIVVNTHPTAKSWLSRKTNRHPYGLWLLTALFLYVSPVLFATNPNEIKEVKEIYVVIYTGMKNKDSDDPDSKLSVAAQNFLKDPSSKFEHLSIDERYELSDKGSPVKNKPLPCSASDPGGGKNPKMETGAVCGKSGKQLKKPKRHPKSSHDIATRSTERLETPGSTTIANSAMETNGSVLIKNLSPGQHYFLGAGEIVPDNNETEHVNILRTQIMQYQEGTSIDTSFQFYTCIHSVTTIDTPKTIKVHTAHIALPGNFPPNWHPHAPHHQEAGKRKHIPVFLSNDFVYPFVQITLLDKGEEYTTTVSGKYPLERILHPNGIKPGRYLLNNFSFFFLNGHHRPYFPKKGTIVVNSNGYLHSLSISEFANQTIKTRKSPEDKSAEPTVLYHFNRKSTLPETKQTEIKTVPQMFNLVDTQITHPSESPLKSTINPELEKIVREMLNSAETEQEKFSQPTAANHNRHDRSVQQPSVQQIPCNTHQHTEAYIPIGSSFNQNTK